MPTYGYRCSNCGHEFEIQQKITDQPLKACPMCQGKLAKILYPVGISFKGSGFYTTDYKGSGKSSDGSSGDVAAKAGGGSESKSESKPESKSESKPDQPSVSKSDSKTEKKAS
ncbi:MAG TPA: FmdB family zinc ribbon protein [Candidatus Eisenbacteria bacterium]|nr:FmdB family zinc ribbon protein [Candidatus Eisenbacteria bacterium]